MRLVSADDRRRVAEAIRAAEGSTSGEIVCVIARAASEYRSIPLLWAAALALILPWFLIRLTAMSAEAIHLAQMAMFCVLALVLSLRPIRFALVPRLLKRGRARQAAREQFYARGLYRTKGQSGMLIYIAEAEHYAEILVDDGIAEKVDHQHWRASIEVLIEAIRRGEAVEGLVKAIGQCGAVLADHCPPTGENPDELPNRLIIL